MGSKTYQFKKTNFAKADNLQALIEPLPLPKKKSNYDCPGCKAKFSKALAMGPEPRLYICRKCGTRTLMLVYS